MDWHYYFCRADHSRETMIRFFVLSFLETIISHNLLLITSPYRAGASLPLRSWRYFVFFIINNYAGMVLDFIDFLNKFYSKYSSFCNGNS